MNTAHPAPASPVRIPVNHTVIKRLGTWASARQFQVRARRGHAVLDLSSPQIPAGDLQVDVDLDHATLKLLVADDAVVDDWDHRGGFAVLSAMCSREFLADLRRARREGQTPTVADPAHTP